MALAVRRFSAVVCGNDYQPVLVNGLQFSVLGGHNWGVIHRAPEHVSFWDVGAEVQIDALAGVLGVQLGSTGLFSRDPGRTVPGLDTVYLAAGVIDLNGLAYWLSR